MFIGRKPELSKLEELFSSNKPECAVIYGRRRIGKTTLINEFIKGKEAIYFTALETTAKENLESLSRCIMRVRLGVEGNDDAIFSSFQAALDAVHVMAKVRRVVLVIDEYPYLAASYPGISSLLQVQIDERFKSSKLMLILCGSSMSFMETQVLGYQSPLYGRRTAQMKILPFGFFELEDCFKRFSKIDLATIYGVTGGVPQYLTLMDDALTVEENIKRNFFVSSAYLFEEPTNLLKQEVREPAHYNAIIKSIATGSSKNSEIAAKVGIESSACTVYLKNLISLGIVGKETPVTEDTKKKTIYTIEDSMFRFWYRFVPDNAALIQNGLIDRVWRKVEPQIPAFMGKVFEDICKQWLWRENAAGRLPVEFVNLGRWWGNDPIRRCEAEIDILAYADDDHALFGECKWTNEKVDAGVLETLRQRSELLRYRYKRLYVFSKTGFTTGCVERAEELSATLVAFSDIE